MLCVWQKILDLIEVCQIYGKSYKILKVKLSCTECCPKCLQITVNEIAKNLAALVTVRPSPFCRIFQDSHILLEKPAKELRWPRSLSCAAASHALLLTCSFSEFSFFASWLMFMLNSLRFLFCCCSEVRVTKAYSVSSSRWSFCQVLKCVRFWDCGSTWGIWGGRICLKLFRQ